MEHSCLDCNWFSPTKSPDPSIAGSCDLFSGNLTHDQARVGCANWEFCESCGKKIEIEPPNEDLVRDKATIVINKVFTLKNGKKILIRTGSEQDSEKAWGTFSSQPSLFYRYIHGITKSMVENWYPKDKIDFNTNYPLNVFALDENDKEAEFIGNSMFIFYQPLSHRSHIAKYGWGIIPGYQGQGIGKLLLHTALKVAREFGHIKKIQTEVVCDNLPAISLYLKEGFKVEGCRIKSWAIEEKLYDTYFLGYFL